tara:strand:+ start:14754 stop:15230 length:477 start_codon:yes stop_codon:yes gene_type:complete
MPLYSVINSKTGEEKELSMTIDEYTIWRDENPDWEKNWSDKFNNSIPTDLDKEIYSNNEPSNDINLQKEIKSSQDYKKSQYGSWYSKSKKESNVKNIKAKDKNVYLVEYSGQIISLCGVLLLVFAGIFLLFKNNNDSKKNVSQNYSEINIQKLKTYNY